MILRVKVGRFFFDSIEDEETEEALTLCSAVSKEGPCTFNVTHEKDDEGKKTGNAGLADYSVATGRQNYSFATGRPNIVYPFTKRMIFRTLGGEESPSHTAVFFLEGPYSKGPGNSFSLPTHEPIMILRDPPGGDSFAFYNNIKTTIRLVTSDFLRTIGAEIATKPISSVAVDPTVCIGGGFGAIVLACKKLAKSKVETGIVITGEIG